MHFIVLKAKTLKKVLLCLLAVFLFSLNFMSTHALAQVFMYSKTRKIPIYCVDDQNKNIALTFDAAWGSDKTLEILDILQKEDITATFFLVGFWVDKNEDLVKEIDKRGFEIGTHSNTHPDLTKLSSTQINLELATSVSKIENLTQKKVKVFRAPFGAYNDTLLTEAEKLGLKSIQWDVDSLDWKGIAPQTITLNVLKKVKSGSIILCHNNADNIAKALPGLILGLKSRGYKFKTVSNLIFEDNFVIDNMGRQYKNLSA